MRYLHYLFIGILLIAFHAQAIAVCCQIQGSGQPTAQQTLVVKHHHQQANVDCQVHQPPKSMKITHLLRPTISLMKIVNDHCVVQLTTQIPRFLCSWSTIKWQFESSSTSQHQNRVINRPGIFSSNIFSFLLKEFICLSTVFYCSFSVLL